MVSVLKGSGSERFLTISIRAPEDEGHVVRQPVNVAVVMDASGSMQDAGKIDYAKRAAKQIVTSMGPQDEYSLVTFNDRARVAMPFLRALHRPTSLHEMRRRRMGVGALVPWALAEALAGAVLLWAVISCRDALRLAAHASAPDV